MHLADITEKGVTFQVSSSFFFLKKKFMIIGEVCNVVLVECNGILDEGLFFKLLQKKSILPFAIIYIPNLVKLKSRSEYMFISVCMRPCACI